MRFFTMLQFGNSVIIWYRISTLVGENLYYDRNLDRDYSVGVRSVIGKQFLTYAVHMSNDVG